MKQVMRKTLEYRCLLCGTVATHETENGLLPLGLMMPCGHSPYTQAESIQPKLGIMEPLMPLFLNESQRRLLVHVLEERLEEIRYAAIQYMKDRPEEAKVIKEIVSELHSIARPQ